MKQTAPSTHIHRSRGLVKRQPPALYTYTEVRSPIARLPHDIGQVQRVRLLVTTLRELLVDVDETVFAWQIREGVGRVCKGSAKSHM